MESMKTIMDEIKETTKKAKAASKVDEIRVMRGMLNDPDFSISIYDKNKGMIGSRCPREEAVKFAANVSSSITGLDIKSATEIANGYEFTKKDAIFLIDNAKDFVSTYLETGRKLPIVQSATTEASLIVRHVDEKTKPVPNGTGTTTIPAYDKVVSKSKCPKYSR